MFRGQSLIIYAKKTETFDVLFLWICNRTFWYIPSLPINGYTKWFIVHLYLLSLEVRLIKETGLEPYNTCQQCVAYILNTYMAYIYTFAGSYIKKNYWTHCNPLVSVETILTSWIVAINFSCFKAFQFRRNNCCLCSRYAQANSQTIS